MVGRTVDLGLGRLVLWGIIGLCIAAMSCNVSDAPEYRPTPGEANHGEQNHGEQNHDEADAAFQSDIPGTDPPPDAELSAPDTSQPQPLSVVITSPTEDIHTHESVPFHIAATGQPDEIWLERNGQLLANLDAPFQYLWETSHTSEGSHEIQAIATRGGERAESEIVTVMIDRTPPTITSRTPRHRDENVWVRTPIVLTFSEPIDARSASGTAVKLEADAMTLSKTMTWSEDQTELTILLDDIPPVPSTIAVTLDGITDRAGNPLNDEGSWEWDLPAWVTQGDALLQEASTRGIAVDGDGTVFVTVSHDQSIRVLTRDNDTGTWEQLGPSVRQASEDMEFPSAPIMVDSAGAPVVAITDYINNADVHPRRSYHRVYRWDGGEWAALGGQINPVTANINGLSELIGADPPTLLYTARDQLDGGMNSLYVARWNENETAWEYLGDAINTEAVPFQTRLGGALVGDTPVVTWRSTITVNGVNSDKVWTRKWDGQSWVAMTSQDRRVNTVNGVPGDPVVACRTIDRCMVAIEQNDQLNDRIRNLYVRRLDGSSWRTMGGSLNIGVPSDSFAFDINIALGADDVPVVVWGQLVMGSFPLSSRAYASRWNRQTEEWERLGDSLDLVSSEPLTYLNMAIDENGQPIVVFREKNSTINRWDVYVRRYNQ